MERIEMLIKKTMTEKAVLANKANGAKSKGSTTPAGKRRAKMNSLKHGFFARELQIAEADRPEYEVLNEELLQQYAPATPMIRFFMKSQAIRECRDSSVMESRAVALQQSSNQERKVEGEKGETILIDHWYGADYRSLQAGLSFLRDLRADVAANGLLHLKQDGPRK